MSLESAQKFAGIARPRIVHAPAPDRLVDRAADLGRVEVGGRHAARRLVLPAVAAVQALQHQQVILRLRHRPDRWTDPDIRTTLVHEWPTATRHNQGDHAAVADERDHLERGHRRRFDATDLGDDIHLRGGVDLLADDPAVVMHADQYRAAAPVEHPAKSLGDLLALAGRALEFELRRLAETGEPLYVLKIHRVLLLHAPITLLRDAPILRCSHRDDQRHDRHPDSGIRTASRGLGASRSAHCGIEPNRQVRYPCPRGWPDREDHRKGIALLTLSDGAVHP
jgi:hypothetical protein